MTETIFTLIEIGIIYGIVALMNYFGLVSDAAITVTTVSAIAMTALFKVNKLAADAAEIRAEQEPK